MFRNSRLNPPLGGKRRVTSFVEHPSPERFRSGSLRNGDRCRRPAAHGCSRDRPGNPIARSCGGAPGRNYGRLPLSFEANQGQASKSVRFLARGQGYGLYLTSEEAVLTLHKTGLVGGATLPAQSTLWPLP